MKNSMLNLHLKDLMQEYEMTMEQLQEKTVNELLSMEEAMQEKRRQQEIESRLQDEEYVRLVKKFFAPYEYLRQWFSEEEILTACTKHVSKRDLCEEYMSESDFCPYKEAEFLRQSYETLPRYTKGGERLMEGKRCMTYVYRIKARYQGLTHGPVILELLYGRYPELQEFDFKAYEYHDYGMPYEIYPKNNIYTPFEALMSGDVDAIVERNRSYAKSYNCGVYTVEAVKERLESEEAKHFFNTIQTATWKDNMPDACYIQFESEQELAEFMEKVGREKISSPYCGYKTTVQEDAHYIFSGGHTRCLYDRDRSYIPMLDTKIKAREDLVEFPYAVFCKITERE